MHVCVLALASSVAYPKYCFYTLFFSLKVHISTSSMGVHDYWLILLPGMPCCPADARHSQCNQLGMVPRLVESGDLEFKASLGLIARPNSK